MTYLPSREAELLAWSAAFSLWISTRYALVGLSEQQSIDYAATHTAFADAYAIATAEETRTKGTIVAKNEAMRDLRIMARALVKIAQAFPGTTDQMRADLDITIPDVEPSPVPVPTSSPIVTVQSVQNRVVNVRLTDSADPTRRGKPPGVSGAAIFAYIGETPPADPLTWSFLFNKSRMKFSIDFPSTVPGGSKIWMCAFWFNSKKESGPASASVCTTIGEGMGVSLKKAA